jgi:transcriptional regulator EpsA
MTGTTNTLFRTHAPLTTWRSGCSRAIDEKAPSFGADEGARFVRILSESRLIRRHPDLVGWLQEVQQFLPHQILIAAWGDFQRWNIKCEVVSHLPGARTAQLGDCAIDDLLRDSYTRWIRGGREPLLLQAAAAAALGKPCGCALHGALRGMPSLLVHGVRDKRSGCDSLYIALDSGSFVAAGGHSRFIPLAHLLLCQLDIVWRRLAAFRLDDLPAADAIAVPRALDLSAREREILVSLSRGSTNSDIAEALDISLFTVKNHLKRIFRKIRVSNRTQAAARYNEALTPSGRHGAIVLAAQQKA